MAELVTTKFEAGATPLSVSTAADCFTRTVYAGIEHALIQLVSEAFDLAEQIRAIDESQWSNASYSRMAASLNRHLEKTSGIFFNCKDIQRQQVREKLIAFKSAPENHTLLQTARDLGVQTPTLDAALGADLCCPRERQMTFLLTPFRHPSGRFKNDADSVLKELSGALYTAMTIAYAQGFELLAEASARRHFHLDLAEVALAWKSGPSTRTEILDDIATAFTATPSLRNLLCDEDLSEKVMARQESLRHAVWRAGELGAFAPAMLASLDYLDSFKDAWLPINLVQIHRNGPRHQIESHSKILMR